MQIGASTGVSAHAASQAAQSNRSLQEASESKRGPDRDGDSDDQVAVNPVSSTPSVNAMGETIGQLIDISA